MGANAENDALRQSDTLARVRPAHLKAAKQAAPVDDRPECRVPPPLDRPYEPPPPYEPPKCICEPESSEKEDWWDDYSAMISTWNCHQDASGEVLFNDVFYQENQTNYARVQTEHCEEKAITITFYKADSVFGYCHREGQECKHPDGKESDEHVKAKVV